MRSTLVFDHLALDVTSDDAAPVRWLEEFLGPCFGDEVDAAARRIPVVLRSGLAAKDLAAFGDGPQLACFTLDSRDERLVQVASTPDRATVLDLDAQALLHVGEAGVEIEYVQDGSRLRLRLMRVLRELATRHASARQRLFVHAGAVEVNGQALVVGGQRRAGKSTLLMHLLRRGGASLLANDRIVIAPGAVPVALGMPTIVTLRPDALRFFPGLLERYGNRLDRPPLTREETRQQAGPLPINHRPVLTPAQFCAWLGVKATAHAPVGLFLFPEQAQDVDGFHLVPLQGEALAARLHDALFPLAVPADPNVFDRLWPDAPRHAGSPEACRAVAATSRGLVCGLGPNAYAHDVGGALLAALAEARA